MSSTEQLVTDAYRLLGTINAVEDAPAPVLMNIGLRVFAQMIDAWAADGWNVNDLTMTGDFISGEPEVTVESTLRLAPGLNVAATGITSRRIQSIDSDTQFTLDGNCSANGSGASIAFSLLPLQPRFEEAMIALLARKLANRTGDEVTVELERMCRIGEAQLGANFFHVPELGFDRAVLATTQRG